MSAIMRARPTAGSSSGEQHLQVAHRGLLEVIAPRVAIEPGAPLRTHADEVARLVQHRVDGVSRRA